MNENADAGDGLSLDELALWYGTDKSSRVHGYASRYEARFAPLRYEPITLLEIGVGGGDSLRLWRAYFPQAKVYGLDVADCPALAEEDVVLFRGSQTNLDVLQRVAVQTGGCDIVIDDGSHRWADQLFAFQTLFPTLRPGGCYAVENLHTSYWDNYKAGDKRAVDFFLELVHEINLGGVSGYGQIENDPQYPSLAGRLTVYQKEVDSITFSKSIVFVKKKAASHAGGPAR